MSRPGDLYGPPIREASVRGGSGRFNWDDVKKDEKFRDTYIGHSIMAPVGRWQKGKDLNWYARDKPTNAEDEKKRMREERAAEIRKIKEAEEDALAEALGFKVEKKSKNEGVSQEELEKALKDEDDAGLEEVQGLGYGSAKPRIGATLPDGTVMQAHPPVEASLNGISVDVDVAVKVDREDSEGLPREDRHRKHKHRRRHDDEDRERRHRHHRREREHRPRSRSPDARRDRDRDRDSERKRDSGRERDSGRRREPRRDEGRGRDTSDHRHRDRPSHPARRRSLSEP